MLVASPPRSHAGSRRERRTARTGRPARARRLAALAGRALQRDDVGAFLDRLPAVARDQAPPSARGCRARPRMGPACSVSVVEHELLVLGADAPARLGLQPAAIQPMRSALPVTSGEGALASRVDMQQNGPYRKTTSAVATASEIPRYGGGSRLLQAPRLLSRSAQSPSTAFTSARAAIAAVSARMIRGPSATAVTYGLPRSRARSSGLNPPSGPISTANDPGCSDDNIFSGLDCSAASSQKISAPVRLPRRK